MLFFIRNLRILRFGYGEVLEQSLVVICYLYETYFVSS